MQHVRHRVPVTALAVWNGNVILAGEGHLLKAYDTSSKTLLASIKIFDSQAIHGLIVSQPNGGARLFAYGGSLACEASISLKNGGLISIERGQISDANDWILDAAHREGLADLIAVVTAHNALKITSISSRSGSHFKTIIGGSNCILYSANIKWLSGSKCLVASGTAFGDVVVWSCDITEANNDISAVSSIHYTFSAHLGSVFGVQLATAEIASLVGGRKQLLATCSDDRTIRLWDLSDLPKKSVMSVENQRQTGFGPSPTVETHAPPLLAKVIGGHLSRIWHVRFVAPAAVQVEPALDEPLSLISFGEDACSVKWVLAENGGLSGNSPYSFKQVDALHAHSGKNIWSVALDHNSGVVSGAADGALILQPCRAYRSLSQQNELPASTIGGQDMTDTCRAYRFVGHREMLASTDHGRVLLLSLDSAVTKQEISKDVAGLQGYSIMDAIDGSAFLAGKTGMIYIYTAQSGELSQVMNAGRKVAGLFATKSVDEAAEHINLLVTTVNASVASLFEIRNVQESSAKPEISNQRELQLPVGFVVTSFAHVHRDGIDIAILGSRNGSLALFKLANQTATCTVLPSLVRDSVHGEESITCLIGLDNTGQRNFLLSVGRDGTYAAHEVIITQDSLQLVTVHQLSLSFGPNIEGIGLSSNSHIIVWGFRSKQFVVYDINEQQEIMTVDCGGAHRNWSFQTEDNGGTFVWTKASKMYRKIQEKLPFRAINSGGHGREIKATAVSPVDGTLIATGAEDTNIKLSRLEMGGFRCLHTLRRHNTGIQHLQWSRDGRYLFSSGGFEEFYVWKVSDEAVPGLSLGVICESNHPNSGASDLRIMHFDLVAHSIVRATDCFRIWMAYSDSTLRLWQYAETTWTLQAKGGYLTACLTQLLRLEGDIIVTGSTDGHLVEWWTDSARERNDWHRRQKVHQSAILSMTTTRFEDQSEIVFTGGDDNAIGITRRTDSRGARTLLLPSAHAAAVTALSIVRSERGGLWLVSTSIDQRLKLWRIDVDLARPGIDGVEVELVENVFTAVADVSGLEQVKLEDGEIGVLVCGVGMDLWRPSFDR